MPYDEFGYSVSMDDNILVAGTYGRTYGDRAAYLFEKPANGWINTNETARLTSDGAFGARIGLSSSISGEVVVLDDYGDALIYEKPTDGWADMKQTLKIRPGISNITAVAVSGSHVITGAPYESFEGKNSGAAFAYLFFSNTPPQIAIPIADTTAFANNTFTLILDPATFTDADQDELSYAATLSDGTSLPNWLIFDADRLTFSGTPRTSDVATIDIKVIARDKSSETTASFLLTVQEAEPKNTNPSEEDNEEEPSVVDEEETVTGVDDDIKSSKVLFYPNPSQGQLTVTTSEAIQQLDLNNAHGQVVFSQQYTSGATTVKLNALSPGLYWINVRTSQSTFTQRIIVQ